MAIIKQSCFALVLSTLVSRTVMGQSYLNFDQCKRVTDLRDKDNNNNSGDSSFTDGREGSQRRTYGNLCSGSVIFTTSTATTTAQTGTGDINSRNGDPFRRFCDLIDKYPNVYNLMASGNSAHTVFAPTDAAFAKIDGLLSRLDDQKVLELHILPQARLTRDLRCGQTFRSLNTQQDRRMNQRTKTRCINADTAQQIGPGNTRNGLNPTIGIPVNIFNAEQFTFQDNFHINFDSTGDAKTKYTIGQDVVSCNGVIHVVDEVMIPGPTGFSDRLANLPGNLPSRPSRPSDPYYGVQEYYGSKTGYYGSKSDYYPKSDYYSGGGSYYYGKSYKKAKKAKKDDKKGKGYKGYGPPPTTYSGYYSGAYGPGYRKLDVEADGTISENIEEPDELFMTDAEFFGTEGLIEDASEEEIELDVRKRRLEAMLEPVGGEVSTEQ
mmetsp:Transcript_20350/g.56612  ORF Transcript_20350/g.56612 Transcript_20350/m.56612 type:complete len:435 (-) Transcript_20350:472-1776(-)|eukprot:CAMPEP_0172365630 /NCGR_PEP_ID=MMETSP1060-20121228/10624_1 /TAXON_ID=37318 /ORGANISM="Pseudo-nitzschia pungens, Strain cf. cingulata" /LENGTH=434 /DNA_ID=CAMNT_0013089011 /DNA_START=103 /DNA_END=1407 /DNA_ORIENTATION=+